MDTWEGIARVRGGLICLLLVGRRICFELYDPKVQIETDCVLPANTIHQYKNERSDIREKRKALQDEVT